MSKVVKTYQLEEIAIEVQSVCSHKGIEAAPFPKGAALKHQNFVRYFSGTKAVADEYGQLIFADTGKQIINPAFGYGV